MPNDKETKKTTGDLFQEYMDLSLADEGKEYSLNEQKERAAALGVDYYSLIGFDGQSMRERLNERFKNALRKPTPEQEDAFVKNSLEQAISRGEAIVYRYFDPAYENYADTEQIFLPIKRTPELSDEDCEIFNPSVPEEDRDEKANLLNQEFYGKTQEIIEVIEAKKMQDARTREESTLAALQAAERQARAAEEAQRREEERRIQEAQEREAAQIREAQEREAALAREEAERNEAQANSGLTEQERRERRIPLAKKRFEKALEEEQQRWQALREKLGITLEKPMQESQPQTGAEPETEAAPESSQKTDTPTTPEPVTDTAPESSPTTDTPTTPEPVTGTAPESSPETDTPTTPEPVTGTAPESSPKTDMPTSEKQMQDDRNLLTSNDPYVREILRFRGDGLMPRDEFDPDTYDDDPDTMAADWEEENGKYIEAFDYVMGKDFNFNTQNARAKEMGIPLSELFYIGEESVEKQRFKNITPEGHSYIPPSEMFLKAAVGKAFVEGTPVAFQHIGEKAGTGRLQRLSPIEPIGSGASAKDFETAAERTKKDLLLLDVHDYVSKQSRIHENSDLDIDIGDCLCIGNQPASQLNYPGKRPYRLEWDTTYAYLSRDYYGKKPHASWTEGLGDEVKRNIDNGVAIGFREVLPKVGEDGKPVFGEIRGFDPESDKFYDKQRQIKGLMNFFHDINKEQVSCARALGYSAYDFVYINGESVQDMYKREFAETKPAPTIQKYLLNAVTQAVTNDVPVHIDAIGRDMQAGSPMAFGIKGSCSYAGNAGPSQEQNSTLIDSQLKIWKKMATPDFKNSQKKLAVSMGLDPYDLCFIGGKTMHELYGQQCKDMSETERDNFMNEQFINAVKSGKDVAIQHLETQTVKAQTPGKPDTVKERCGIIIPFIPGSSCDGWREAQMSVGTKVLEHHIKQGLPQLSFTKLDPAEENRALVSGIKTINDAMQSQSLKKIAVTGMDTFINHSEFSVLPREQFCRQLYVDGENIYDKLFSSPDTAGIPAEQMQNDVLAYAYAAMYSGKHMVAFAFQTTDEKEKAQVKIVPLKPDLTNFDNPKRKFYEATKQKSSDKLWSNQKLVTENHQKIERDQSEKILRAEYHRMDAYKAVEQKHETAQAGANHGNGRAVDISAIEQAQKAAVSAAPASKTPKTPDLTR